jgi:hypothetical protein
MEGAYKSNEMLTQALVMLCQKALAQCDKRVGEDSIFCTVLADEEPQNYLRSCVRTLICQSPWLHQRLTLTDRLDLE